MSAIHRRPGMSRREFSTYLREVHGELASRDKLQVAVYRQNRVIDMVTGATGDESFQVAPDRDAIIELLFNDLGAMFETMSAPYTREVVGPDGVNFSDLPTAAALVATVDEFPLPRAGRGEVKVMCFLTAAPGLSVQEFGTWWAAAHGSADASALESIRDIRVNRRMPEGDEFVGYFGGRDAPAYQGAVSLWFDSADDALAQAVGYLAALDGVVDLPHSFAAIVDEHVVFSAAR